MDTVLAIIRHLIPDPDQLFLAHKVAFLLLGTLAGWKYTTRQTPPMAVQKTRR